MSNPAYTLGSKGIILMIVVAVLVVAPASAEQPGYALWVYGRSFPRSPEVVIKVVRTYTMPQSRRFIPAGYDECQQDERAFNVNGVDRVLTKMTEKERQALEKDRLGLGLARDSLFMKCLPVGYDPRRPPRPGGN